MELLFGVVFLSLIFSVGIFIFAWRDRDESGKLKLIAEFFVLYFIAIPSSLLLAFWLMWVDPDRVREGNDYWINWFPLSGVFSFIITFIGLLLWWGLKRISKNDWLPAVIVPFPFLFLVGPYGVVILTVSCFVALFLLRYRKTENKNK